MIKPIKDPTEDSIKELRRICQAPRNHCDTWHGKNIARPLSIYITIMCIRLGVSPNFVTGIFLFLGIIASLFLISDHRVVVFAGAVLFQLWYLLDHVDGEIARYKNELSLTGVYFDYVSHYIVHPLAFFCLGLGLFFRLGHLSSLILGILAGLSIILINAVVDIYKLILCGKTKKDVSDSTRGTESLSLPKRIFSFLHHLCIFPNVIDMLFV